MTTHSGPCVRLGRTDWTGLPETFGECAYCKARAEGRVAGLEEAAKECDAAHAKWCENCDRTDIEHSGPSYAAAVAGAAATRDCAAAIRALKEKA